MKRRTPRNMDSEDGTLSPSGYRSPTTGRTLPDYSYYASRGELISWVNNLLDLALTRLEEVRRNAWTVEKLDAARAVLEALSLRCDDG